MFAPVSLFPTKSPPTQCCVHLLRFVVNSIVPDGLTVILLVYFVTKRCFSWSHQC